MIAVTESFARHCPVDRLESSVWVYQSQYNIFIVTVYDLEFPLHRSITPCISRFLDLDDLVDQFLIILYNPIPNENMKIIKKNHLPIKGNLNKSSTCKAELVKVGQSSAIMSSNKNSNPELKQQFPNLIIPQSTKIIPSAHLISPKRFLFIIPGCSKLKK